MAISGGGESCVAASGHAAVAWPRGGDEWSGFGQRWGGRGAVTASWAMDAGQRGGGEAGDDRALGGDGVAGAGVASQSSKATRFQGRGVAMAHFCWGQQGSRWRPW